MKGKIEIICDDKGTHISIGITEAKEHDSLFLVHALGKSLGLSAFDYEVLSYAESEGVLDGAAPMAVAIDTNEFFKQLKETADES